MPSQHLKLKSITQHAMTNLNSFSRHFLLDFYHDEILFLKKKFNVKICVAKNHDDYYFESMIYQYCFI